jgi:hypothetical protein
MPEMCRKRVENGRGVRTEPDAIASKMNQATAGQLGTHFIVSAPCDTSICIVFGASTAISAREPG